MSSVLRKVGCSILIAAVIVGAMAWCIGGLFEGDTVAQSGDVASTITPPQPDSYTNVMDKPVTSVDGTHTEPGGNFEDGDSTAKFPFSAEDSVVTKPGASTTPNTNNSTTNNGTTNNGTTNNGTTNNGTTNNGTTNNGTTNNGTTNNGTTNNGTTNNGGSSNSQTTTPSVQISNIASIIKGHNYSSGLDVFQSSKNDIPTDTTALMTAINKGYNKCSFVAIRLSDGATIAYNANGTYNCASSYKAFVSLYVFKQAEAGVYNLDTPLTYTAADYHPGSGIIQSSPIGSVYTLGQLADYSIRYSDNIAYTMLQRYVNRADLAAYGQKLGCPSASKFATTSWPVVTAVDAALWWAEIYKFAQTSSYGAKYYNICLSATNPIIKKALGGEHAVAHKSGSTSYYFHDAGVVHSENGYIIAFYSHNPTNYTSDNTSYVAPVIREIDKLINP